MTSNQITPLVGTLGETAPQFGRKPPLTTLLHSHHPSCMPSTIWMCLHTTLTDVSFTYLLVYGMSCIQSSRKGLFDFACFPKEGQAAFPPMFMTPSLSVSVRLFLVSFALCWHGWTFLKFLKSKRSTQWIEHNILCVGVYYLGVYVYVLLKT